MILFICWFLYRQKRGNITPITFSDGSPPAKKPQSGSGNKGNKNRGQRTMYSPPGGKYSKKAGAAPTFGDADYGSGFGGGEKLFFVFLLFYRLSVALFYPFPFYISFYITPK